MAENQFYMNNELNSRAHTHAVKYIEDTFKLVAMLFLYMSYILVQGPHTTKYNLKWARPVKPLLYNNIIIITVL